MSLLFKNDDHQKFYYDKLSRLKDVDIYQQSLVYLLGLSETTRMHFQRIFNIETNTIQPDCVYAAWNTSSTIRIIHLAFNLYTNGTPTPFNLEEKTNERLQYIQSNYCPIELFSDYENFEYFVQALRLRFNIKNPGEDV